MSFGENLQYLRKKNGITQEDLADKLDVTRQTVSKWEQDGNYPETEKILKLCKMFGVTMDELLMGDVAGVVTEDDQVKEKATIEQYEKEFKGFACAISIAVLIAMLGVALYSFFCSFAEPTSPVVWSQSKSNIISCVSLFMCLAATTSICIAFGIKHENFVKEYDLTSIAYDKQTIKKYSSRMAAGIVSGIALIIAGLILFICFSESAEHVILYLSSLFMLLIGASAFLIIYTVMGYERVTVEVVQKEKRKKNSTTAQRLLDSMYAIIMIVATIIYLCFGFIDNNWQSAAIIYASAGLLCGVVSIIRGVIDKK